LMKKTKAFADGEEGEMVKPPKLTSKEKRKANVLFC